MSGSTPHRVVLDASALVAALTDSGAEGEWATAFLTGARLAAPDLMPFEAGNILRRQAAAGILDASAATLAHLDLTALSLQLCPYSALAARAWALREDLTIHDASYVALAELLEVPLVTLDARLASAHGPRCAILAFQPD